MMMKITKVSGLILTIMVVLPDPTKIPSLGILREQTSLIEILVAIQ